MNDNSNTRRNISTVIYIGHYLFNRNPKANKYLYHSMSLVRVDEWKNIRTIVSPIFSSARLKGNQTTLNFTPDPLCSLYLFNFGNPSYSFDANFARGDW